MEKEDGFAEALRQALVDVMVPEIRDLREEIEKSRKESEKRFEALQKEINERFEAAQKKMDQRFESFQEQLDDRFESFQEQMDERFEAVQTQLQKNADRIAVNAEGISNLDGKMDVVLERLEVADRVSRIEGEFS